MFSNPDLTTRFVREHHRELLAQASQRHQHRRPAPGTPGPAVGITRHLAAAIAMAGRVAAQAPGWGSRSLS